MSTAQRCFLRVLTAWGLTFAAGPVLAEYYSYQGQIQIQTAPGDGCAEISPAPFNITIYGRDDAPRQRIDGYLDGEKIVHAHFSGNYLNQLSLTYPGESSPSHTLRLRTAGDGAFVGDLEAKSLLTALSGCKYSNALIKFTKTATHTQAAYDQAASLFQMDSRAVQAYVLGMRGKAKEATPVLQEGLDIKEKTYGTDHPQLLPYYFLLAQLHDAEGSYREEGPLYRKALAVCEKAYGPESRCAAMSLTSLGGAQYRTGDFADAESSVRRAMAICDKACGPESALTGTNLNTLGAILIFTGHFGDAETTLNKALALNKKTLGPADANVGLNLNNLAVLYRYTGQYGKSEAAMRQALAIDEKALGADSPLVILNTIVLAQILRISGRNAEAEPIARRGLAAALRVLGPERPDHPALSMALGGLAEVLREKAAYTEAEPLYRRALANDIKYLGADHPDVATISLLLAKLLRAAGRDAEALALLKSAYRITRISTNQMIAWRVPGELM
jgi:tetratricopeptide (TPR) repeat protein